MLVDTGAANSFIHQSQLQHVRIRQRTEGDPHFKLADGSTPFPTNGTVIFPLRFGHIVTYVHAFVTNRLSCSCILGNDWITQYGVDIHTMENKIVVHTRNESTEHPMDNSSRSVPIYTITRVKCNRDDGFLSRYPRTLKDDELELSTNAVTRSLIRQQQRDAHPKSPKFPFKGFVAMDDPRTSNMSPLRPSIVRAAQLEDDDSQQRIAEVHRSTSEDLCVHNGVLLKVLAHGKRVPWIPRALVPDVLQAFHSHPTAANSGRDRTYDKLRRRAFWPQMYNGIRRHVVSCPQCAPYNKRRRKAPRLLEPVEPPRPRITMYKPSDDWEFVQESRRAMTQVVRTNVHEHQQQARKRFDKNRQDISYLPDEPVFLRQHGMTGKGGKLFDGPFYVVERRGKNTYLVRDDDPANVWQVHASDMEPFPARSVQ